MEIRQADERDIPRILELLRQVCLVHRQGRPDLFRPVEGKYTAWEVGEILKDSQKPIFVAVEEDGFVAGYIFCIFEQHVGHNVLTDIKTLYIDDLCVDETRRGRGIGRRLYEFAVDFARKNGCYNLTLNVWSCNPSAMKFYEACGLAPQKIHMETIL